jgi:hypothetical protein
MTDDAGGQIRRGEDFPQDNLHLFDIHWTLMD